MKKIVACCMLFALGLSAQAQVFDLSTGVVNGSSTLIFPGSNDDTWQVFDPLGSTITPKVCNPSTSPAWATTSCSGWITPSLAAGNLPSGSASSGDYYYITSVNITSTCDITSAYLNLNSIAGDNTVPNIYVNGYLHSTGIPNNSNNNYSAVSTGISINVASELVVGSNDIIIEMNNVSGVTGLNLCGNLTVSKYTLTPAFTINSISCSGYVAATGYASTGPGTSFSWKMDECNSGGALVVGGYSYTGGSSGTPGNYLFPAAPCGKYYKIQLTTATSCKSASTSQVIFIPCPPSVNLGSDVTICYGTCTNIGITAITSGTYSWTSSAGAIAATTNQINVCPAITTTYTITATSGTTGCSATDAITVNVLPNDPSFSFTATTSNPSYYTIVATPNQTTLTGLTGFGYAWYVEDIVSGTSTFIINNPSCWWTAPPYATNFNGFDHTVYAYSGTATLASCSTPTLGKFLYNHNYKITRATWSDQCGWTPSTLYINTVKSLGVEPIVHVTEGDQTADMSYLMATGIQQSNADNKEQFVVYPNPGNGVFTIETGNSTTAAIAVYDALGKEVKVIQQTGFKFAIDLTGFPKGIYLVNIMSEGKLTSKKIILE